MAPQNDIVVRKCFPEIHIRLPFSKRTLFVIGNSTSKKLKQLRSLLAEKPNDVDLRLNLAHLLADEGLNEEALAEWSKANMQLPFDSDVQGDSALSQKNAWSHYIIGLILYNKGAVEEAIVEWDKASSLDQYGVGDLARIQVRAAQNSEALG